MSPYFPCSLRQCTALPTRRLRDAPAAGQSGPVRTIYVQLVAGGATDKDGSGAEGKSSPSDTAVVVTAAGGGVVSGPGANIAGGTRSTVTKETVKVSHSPQSRLSVYLVTSWSGLSGTCENQHQACVCVLLFRHEVFEYVCIKVGDFV